ncbi:DUF6029 family protein [Saccharicrinis sp. FJH54]|uniref:DUF6029 family protein n=1 Tax=Saccharicrinis sp. FJH54 TaxID=3344665 RepID=UPI0035D4CF1A
MARFVIPILLLSFPLKTLGQLSLYHLAEYQHGNIPGTEPENLNTLYDQFNLQYRWKPLKASLRIEQFYSPDSLSGDYQKISQFLLNYRKRGLDIKLGNFYETLGKGLLFRGYEISNAVYEDQVYRVKQGFYKDFLGAYAGYTNQWFSVKALSGKMLNNQLPITSNKRRENYINAGEAQGYYNSFYFGSVIMNSMFNNRTQNFLSLYTGGSIVQNISYYGEYASAVGSGQSYVNTSMDSRYGAYFNVTYSIPGFGISAEVKDYHNFFIGSGFSDPPTLVKEHSYRLLNRSTHVPDLNNESGYQVELFFAPTDQQLITVNHSRTVNKLYDNFSSFEYFVEWYATICRSNQLKLFADFSGDEIRFEPERYTTGIYYTHYLGKEWSLTLESEAQWLKRQFPNSAASKYHNLFGSLAVNLSTTLSATFVLEFTDDPVAADLSNTAKIETSQFFPGLSLSYRPDRRNALQLFAGERRGGPACSAGICYEVLDFKGIELRWILKI